MERRIKLTMAAVALGLLVAGAVRRWAKEGSFDLLRDERTGEVASAPPEAEFDARPAADWTAGNQPAVTPALAEFPVAMRQPVENPSPPPAYVPAPQPSFIPSGAPRNEAHDSEYNDPASTQIRPGAAPASSGAYYVIQPNDSFWTISQRVYGTGRYFQALWEHNRRACPQPDRLPQGVTIETPEPYLLERAYPDHFR